MNASSLIRQARILVARATQLIGRSGWLGLAMSALALGWLIREWPRHSESEPPVVLATAPQAPPPAALTPPSPTVTALPSRDDLALLLTQVQQIAVAQGLAWTAADYKLLPATDAAPVSLEVRCSLKGPYVKLRQAVAQWHAMVPGLAIRDLAMSRPNSDTPDVDAKLVLVIFMQDRAGIAIGERP